MRILALLRLSALLLLAGLAAARADAGTTKISVALDTDSNAATGCALATADGTVPGIEQIATTVITTGANGAVVTRLERQLCAGGGFGAPVVYDATGWNVGLGNGTGGSAVVETSIPLSILPSGAAMRALVTSDNDAGGQDATAAFAIALAPEQAVAIPLSPWLVPPLALLLFALTGWLRRRHPGEARLAVVVAVFAVSGVAWAATALRDGNVGDWAGLRPAVSDATGDAPVGADLIAVFFQQDPTTLYLRVDADIRGDAVGANGAPTVDAGPDQTITLPSTATLAGTASDDGLPNPPGHLATTWSLVSGPDTGVVFGDATALDTTAAFQVPGTYTLRLTAGDGALSSTSDLQVTVGDGVPLLLSIPDRTIALGTRYQQLLVAADANVGDTLSYSLLAAPAGASLNPSPLVDWIPTAAQLGSNTFTARVTDAAGHAATSTFHVTVVHVNQPPRLAPQPSVMLPVGATFSRTLQATDPDAGDTLAFALAAGPAGMTLTGAALHWATTGTPPGDYPVTIGVTDAAGLSDSKSFTVTLTPAAPPPVAKDDSYTVKVGRVLTVPAPGVLANDVYAGAGTLTATRLTDPGVGALTTFDDDGSFAYQAPATPPGEPFAVAKLWNASAGSDRFHELAADLNGDGYPDVVSFDNNAGIRARSGQDGSQLWSADVTGATDCTLNSGNGMDHRVLADVDDSGHPTLAQTAKCSREGSPWHDSIIAFDHLGKVKWVSPPLSKPHPDIRRGATPVPPGGFTPGGLAWQRGLSVARLTAGGAPVLLLRVEIPVDDGTTYYVDEANAFHYAGCRAVTGLVADENVACRATLVISGADGSVLQALVVRNPAATAIFGGPNSLSEMPPIAMDVDGDGRVDLVSGTEVWKQNAGGGFDLAWQLAHSVHDTAVADLDGDGRAEIVHVRNAQIADADLRGIFVYGDDGQLRRRIPLQGVWITPLTIADVDGDGRSDIVIGADGTVYAFRDDGRPIWAYQVPPDVPDDPILAPIYTQPAQSSQVANAAPQVYDLDGDGVAEVVFSGYSRIMILDGRTGLRKVEPYWTFNFSYHDVSALMLIDVNDDGRVDILQNAAFNFNCLNPGVAPACAGLIGPTVLTSGGANWLPGPKVFPNVQYRSTAIDADARVLHDTKVSRVFRTPEQQGTVRDPRLARATSFTYAASAGGGTSPPGRVVIDIVPDNEPPVFTSTPPTSLWQRFAPTPPGGLVTNTYDVSAVDPDAGDTIAFSLKSAPSWVTMSGPARIRFEPTCGSYGYPCPWGWTTVVVTATDSRGASTDQIFIVNLTTDSRTVPDVAGMSFDTASSALAALDLQGTKWVESFSARPVGTVLAQDAVAGTVVGRFDDIRLTVSKGPQPVVMPFVVGQPLAPTHALLAAAGLSVDAATVFSTTIPAGEIMDQSPAAGTELSPATAPPVALTVSAGGPLPAPIASIVLEPGPGPALRLAGEELQYKAVAILADGTSADVTLTAAWSSSAPGVATVSAAGFAKAIANGTTTITASLAGTSGQGALNVAPLVPGDATGPTAAITSPAGGAAVLGPTDVIGTASDPNFLRYELAIAPAGDTSFTVIAEGTTAVTDGILGTLDPTLLVNDLYTLRLTVFDRGENRSVATSTVQLNGNRKVGFFSVTFTDLELPMSGVPITISRTYDSRDRARGDFGIGWRLGLQTLRLRSNRVLGTGWVRSVSGISVSLAATDEHKVSLTLPDGRVEEFDMVVSPTSNVGSLDATTVTGFVARPGTQGTLRALGNGDLLILGGGPEDELVDDSTLDTYDPKLFRYTAADGVQLEIHRTEGVRKITDLNGNTVTIGPGGIVHSAGRSVVFGRDAKGRITQITDPAGNVQTYAYDANGDLVGHADAAGGVSKYAYDRSHGLIDMQDPAGHHPSRNDYDAEGRLVVTTDANGNRITITRTPGIAQEIVRDRLGNPTIHDYDAAGNVVAKTDALGGVRTYTYDSRNNQLSETDPLGRVASRTYDGRNNVLTSTDFDGNTTVSTYNALGQPLTITDPEGRTTTNVFDAGGNLAQTTDPEGGITRFTYDGAGNLLTRTNPLNQVTTFTYDGAGNKLTETDPLGHTTSHAYDANGRMLGTTDAAGNTEHRAYDSAGRVTGATDKLGNVTTFTYSPVGDGKKVATRTDALGRLTRYDYDAVGNLVRTTLPDGAVDATTYDAESRELTRTNRDGHATSFQYDALGRRTRVTHPDGAFTSTSWDAADRTLTQTDERGRTTTHAYAPNRQTVTDPLGHVTVHEFDSKRRRVRLTDARSYVTTFAYDSKGNLTRTTFPDATFRTTTYDAAKRRIAETDQAGRSTRFGHDAAGRPTVVTDAAGGVTTFTYDAIGNRLTQTDANGRTTHSGYDALGRVVSRTRPSGTRESFVFDASGHLLSHTDFNGQTTSFVVDAMGRVTRKNLPGGSTVPYAWTPGGLRAQAGGDSYDYDARGRVTQEHKASGVTLTYTYDDAGNRTSLTAPQGTISYAHDALNRLATVIDTAGTTTYGYDAAGNLATTAYPNGITTTHGYDTLNRLVGVTHAGPAGILSAYAYTLGAAGNRVQVVEAGPATAGRTVTYSYDPVYRLTQELIAQPPGPNVSISYAYDAAGNRTQMNRNGTVTTYAYDGNDRLLTETTGATTFTSTYDDNGNLKSRGDGVTADTYAYDAENRLIGASSAAGAATFTYDADGMRTGRTVGGVTTTFLLDKAAPAAACRCASDAQPPLAQVLVETRGANVVRYTHGHALIGQTQPGSGASFHLADGQRSHRQLTNAAGTVTDTYDFDAFGVLLAAGGSTPNVYLYAGEQLDPNLGFYYLRARHYQQATGRFVSTDPELGSFFDPMSLHRYLYAHANPVDNRDPSGRADYNLTSLMFAQVLAKSIGVGFIATIGTRALGIAKDWNTALTYGAGFTLVGLTWFGGTAVLAANELAAAGAAGTTAIPAGMLNSFLLAVETGEMAIAQGIVRSYLLRTFLFSAGARCVFLTTVTNALPYVVGAGLTATATYTQGNYFLTGSDRTPLIAAGLAQLRLLAGSLGCQ